VRHLMQDLSTTIVALSAWTAIGWPLCFALPPAGFRARFMIAPPAGLAVFGIAGTVLYTVGVAPSLSMIAVVGAGFAIGLALALRRGEYSHAHGAKTLSRLAAATAVVIFVCLLPAWTGGPQFRIFQGNVYDQMTFWAGSVAVRTHDYASITAVESDSSADPVLARGAWFVNNRGAISITEAAVADLSRQDAVRTTYPFMVALQVVLFFATVFLLRNVFCLAYPLALFLPAALTVGFFQQYIFDINAWSELAAQPLYLLFITFVAIAFAGDRFTFAGILGIARLASILGLLAGAVLYIYPEGLAVYGTAATGAAALGMIQRKSRNSRVSGCVILAVGACVSLTLSALFWSGTMGFLFRQYSRYAGLTPDWWLYFQRHLFGSEKNYVTVLADPASDLQQKVEAWFSLPVEGVVSGLGLHFVLPRASWNATLATAWKLVLYCFLAILIASAITAMKRIWRADRDGTASRMMVACIAGSLVPFGVAWSGLYWAAGAGLSMAAPMLLLFFCAPLLAHPEAKLAQSVGRAVSMTLVLAHFVLGLLRPVLVTEWAGIGLPGLPGAAALVRAQKGNIDWDVRRWSAELRACRGVFLAIEDPVLLMLVRRVAVDIEVPWAAVHAPVWPSEQSSRPYLPNGWEKFDCVASTSVLAAKESQTLIWLSKDRTIFDFLDGPTGELEIGTETPAGVVIDGLSVPENDAKGAMRWTFPVARVEVPNNPSAPASNLRLELRPMPLAADKLKILINGKIAYDNVIPIVPVTLPLAEFASDHSLAIELLPNSATHYPNDPRDLGVAIATLRLSK
jgi:hypothetical protein